MRNVLICLFVACCAGAWGGGVLIPSDAELPPLSVKYHRVEASVENSVATTKVSQAFYNSTSRRLEATFVFPLPAQASISQFAMYINGKRTEGELLEASKARGIYEDIVRRMKDPGLLEYMGNDLLRARIFPIEPRSDQRIEIEYAQVLQADGGIYSYLYPLRTGDQAAETLEDFSVSLRLESDVPLKAIFSPSHDVYVKRNGNRSATIGFEEERAPLDRDFVLMYTVSQEDIGVTLLTHNSKEEDGYFMLMVAPDEEIHASKVLAKDMTFVIDVSGSMKEENKMEQVKQALLYCVKGLRPKDRFNVVTFSTEADPMFEALVEASPEHVERACDRIGGLRARGWTHISDAFRVALGMQEKHSDKRHRSLVFLTDGKPTVGVTDTESLLTEIGSANPGLRLFVFGVGSTVNTHLLDRIAGDSGGASLYVKPKEEIELAVSTFFDKASFPVLTDLSLDFGSIRVHKVYPEKLPDLYKGSQLVVLGRYRNHGEVAVRLKGNVAGERREVVSDALFPARERDNDYVPRLWAVRRVGYLLDEMRLHGENQELRDEVVDLSKQYGILTPYTSYLVVEDEKVERPAPRPPVSRRPVPEGGGRQADRGWGLSRMKKSLLGRGEAGEAPTSDHAQEESKGVPLRSREQFMAQEGESAVQAAKEIRSLKEADMTSSEAMGPSSMRDEIKRVGQTTFYLMDDVWVDARYREDLETLRVKFGSDAYFQICQREPELKKLLSVGDRVLLVWKGKALAVGPDGKERLTAQELRDFLG